ncbi:hypothetical protein, partial [Cupriavidus pauculus]|uniref:hypothetical protein n=1 Tax=Cupriavidus pauculus TaxID=82633 RepID=UPI0030F6AE75
DRNLCHDPTGHHVGVADLPAPKRSGRWTRTTCWKHCNDFSSSRGRLTGLRIDFQPPLELTCSDSNAMPII